MRDDSRLSLVSSQMVLWQLLKLGFLIAREKWRESLMELVVSLLEPIGVKRKGLAWVSVTFDREFRAGFGS